MSDDPENVLRFQPKPAAPENKAAGLEVGTAADMLVAVALEHGAALIGAVVVFRIAGEPDDFITGVRTAGLRMSEALPLLAVAQARIVTGLTG